MREQITNFLPRTEGAEMSQPIIRPRSFWLGVLVLLIVVILGTRGLISRELPNDPAIYDPVTLEPKEPESILKRLGQFVFQSEYPGIREADDGITVLLLGMGGEGHDGPYLTDTIIIARFDPETGDIALVSIPRDLAVSMPGHGTKKINHLNAIGEQEKAGWGAAKATEAVEELFDLSIDYYARVDFRAFEQMIHEIGGITVEVERPFTDSLFPAPNSQYQTLSFAQGRQEMSGKRALQFARSRHGTNGEGSDFARATRQQKILLAIKDKMLSFQILANPIKIHAIIETLDQHLTTNMKFGEIIGLVKIARSKGERAIRLLTLDAGPDGLLIPDTTPEGAFILRPKNDMTMEDVGKKIQLHLSGKYVEEKTTLLTQSESKKEEDGEESARPTVEIQNGTWRAGLAANKTQELEPIGIVIEIIGNTAIRPQENSGVYTLLDKPFHKTIAEQIALTLGIPLENLPLPAGVVPNKKTDIFILLGESI